VRELTFLVNKKKEHKISFDDDHIYLHTLNGEKALCIVNGFQDLKNTSKTQK